MPRTSAHWLLPKRMGSSRSRVYLPWLESLQFRLYKNANTSCNPSDLHEFDTRSRFPLLLRFLEGRYTDGDSSLHWLEFHRSIDRCEYPRGYWGNLAVDVQLHMCVRYYSESATNLSPSLYILNVTRERVRKTGRALPV